MEKPMLEVIMGIPLPGQYDNLKGIDLWGSGEVFVQDGSKDREMTPLNLNDNISQKVAAKTAKFKIFQEAPVFTDLYGKIIPYKEFTEVYGEIIDPEGYSIVTGMWEAFNQKLDEKEMDTDTNIYMYEASDTENPFMSKWYPTILENVEKPQFKTKIHNITSDFINKNHEALSVRYPSTNITLPKNVVDDILILCGMNGNTPKAVSELIDHLNVKTDFKSITQSPHQIIFTAILMAATQIKSQPIINDMITLIAFTMYPLIFRKYFKVVDPNKAAMEEAVLTASLKFYIAKTDDLLSWVRILTQVPYDFYKERFDHGSKNDILFIHFLNRLRNTMNQQFKSLYAIYKKAYENKSLGKLHDDEFVTLSSNTDKIQIYTMSVYDKINDSGFKANVCLGASKHTKLSNDTLTTYIKEFMKDTKKYDLHTLILQTLTIYFNMGTNEDFLGFCLKIYPKMVRGKDNIFKPISKYFTKLGEQLTEFDEEFSDRYILGIYLYFAILININMNNITNKLSELSVSQVTQSLAPKND
jgi:hypothetical protein